MSKLLEIKNLKKLFPIKSSWLEPVRYVHAVDDISFTINKGETFGLVGESGCGKTTVGRTVIRLYEPTSGQIIYDGKDVTLGDMLPYRKKMQIIFQDPYASLDPRMTVGDIIAEALDIHRLSGNRSERDEKIHNLLTLVGLSPEHGSRYPHEFSGGQRQRIGIARALAVRPEFIVCDEPISALDVSIQAQVMNMLEDLQRDFQLTYLFIAHDLAVVKHISTNVGVMYLGKMMEITNTEELYKSPLHPYTQALLSAIPVPDPKISRSRKRVPLEGDVPSPIDPKPGCRFRQRCKYAMPICGDADPELKEVGPGHWCACYLLDKK